MIEWDKKGKCSHWMKGYILKRGFTMNERMDIKASVHNEWKDGY